MNWMELLSQKRAECEQHKTWEPYWQCIHRLEAAKLAFDDNVDDCMGNKAWEKYREQAGVTVSDQQHAVFEELASSGEQWSPPAEVDLHGDKLPLEIALMIPYASGLRTDKEKSARTVVVLIDTNKRLSEANREVLRRALFNLCDIELMEEQPIPPDVELFRTMRDRQLEHAKLLRKHFEEQPCEPHVPKSQRHDFAQTRGPRPQHNNYFSKQNQRGRGRPQTPIRGRKR